MNELDRALSQATAALLSAMAGAAGALGLGAAALTIGLAAAGLARPEAAAVAAVLVPLERTLALRLHFDARLFAGLSGGLPGGLPSLAALDHALQALRLRAASAAPRPLADRVRGAMRLMAWHGFTAAAQFAALILGVIR